ncbi:uncharacterized protein [Linepithema humile]|uniref:uncharacterized protein n=1 Tax=Linepithema humile TaxID=83485 RepID=UPI0006238FA8|nr:PREDICTED: uncharacterized protein LOC105677175 [Linepithema humile]
MNDTDTTVSDILSGRQPICLSLHIAGGIVIAIIILSCCCALCVRNKCARLCNKLTGKKKKEKHFDIEEGRKKRGSARKLRKKRKRTLSPDVVHAEKELTTPIIAREQERSENASPITCYKCCPKKKRRRRLKR